MASEGLPIGTEHRFIGSGLGDAYAVAVSSYGNKIADYYQLALVLGLTSEGDNALLMILTRDPLKSSFVEIVLIKGGVFKIKLI